MARVVEDADPYGRLQGVRYAGRCGERIERCRWQKKRDERVAAVKISSVRRKAAQKFWAPQQDHRPLRKCNKRCNGRATARVAPTKALQGVRRGGALPLPRAGKSAKRRRWRMQRAGFEEVPRLADTTVAGNRLARRWAREPRPYEFFAIQIFAKKKGCR